MANTPNKPWTKIASEIVHKNNWFSIRRDQIIGPDGKPGEYNVLDGAHGAFIAALDEDQNIYLIHKYRYPTAMMSLEIPAGGIERGEEPLAAAKRELQEETGLVATDWKSLGKFQAENAYTSNLGYLFMATGISENHQHEQLIEGITRLEKIPLTQAFQLVKFGEITDSQTVTCLMLLALELGNIQ